MRRSGCVSGNTLAGRKYVVVVALRELVVTVMFSGGTSAGLVYALGVWTNAIASAEFSNATRFHGRSGKSAAASYSPTTTIVSYWLSTGRATVMSKRGM